MSDNFVDIIGFQLERVHTGVISWLLDTETLSVPMSDKLVLLSRLLNTSLQDDGGIKIKPIQEYPFGRSRRIDLVVKVSSKKGDTRSLVIECKTDSDIKVTQLKQSKEAFLKKNPSDDCSFFVLALGASQFTYKHLANDIKDLGFIVLDVPTTLRIFGGLSIKGNNKIYEDWYRAIEKEEERFSDIDKVLSTVENTRAERLKKRDYRLGFPLFYMFYAKLRELLEIGPFKNWAIYSGKNNPVMNWHGSKLEDESFPFYWEFNKESLKLKARRRKIPLEKWSSLRNEIQRLCNHSQGGQKTSDSKGNSVTIYKWDFDFCRESVDKIAIKTNAILKELHEKLRLLTRKYL